MSGWIDITQPLTSTIAHWPGDTPFSYQRTYTKEESGSVNIGQITTSLHTGTHIDAPFHFTNDGKTVDELDLAIYIGKATVIDVSQTDIITPEIVKQYEWGTDITRLLLKTSLPNSPKRFPEKIPELDPAIGSWLQNKGIRLLGVDMPSVDDPDSKELAVHRALHHNGVFILENIMLDHVNEGNYELIALPLAIHGADGSPVRAVLRAID